MREIKFRVWMSPDKYMLSHDELMKIPVKYHDVFEGNSKYPCMQYTGLNDKNGVEIYEGDIINHSEFEGCVFEYRFVDGSFSAVEFIDGEEQSDWNISISDLLKYCKIIGNIYENPELLKDE